MDEHERELRIEEVQLAQDHVDRDRHGDRRKEAAAEDEDECSLAAAEAFARERVSRERTENEVEKHDEECDDKRVAQPVRKRPRLLRDGTAKKTAHLVRLGDFTREDVVVVLGRRGVGDPVRRALEQGGLGLKTRAQGPEERHQDHQREHEPRADEQYLLYRPALHTASSRTRTTRM